MQRDIHNKIQSNLEATKMASTRKGRTKGFYNLLRKLDNKPNQKYRYPDFGNLVHNLPEKPKGYIHSRFEHGLCNLPNIGWTHVFIVEIHQDFLIILDSYAETTYRIDLDAFIPIGFNPTYKEMLVSIDYFREHSRNMREEHGNLKINYAK